MAAACWSAGLMTTEGCRLQALGSGCGSSSCGGSGCLWAVSGGGVWSRWWATFLPVPLPRPCLGGGGGDSEGGRQVCLVTLLGRAPWGGGGEGAAGIQWRWVGPLAGGAVAEIHTKAS